MAQLMKPTPHELLGLCTVRTFYSARVGFYTVYEAIMRYRYVRKSLLEHILGGRDKPGSEARETEGPISERQLRRITNDLLAEGFIKEEKRVDLRDKQDYVYFCVDFERQWKVIRYKVANMRAATEAKVKEAGTADLEKSEEGEQAAYECTNPSCGATFSELDLATMLGASGCDRCHSDVRRIERSGAIEAALRFKEQVNLSIKFLEDGLQSAKESNPRWGPSPQTLYEEAKKKQDQFKVSSGPESKAYDDVLTWAKLAGSQDQRVHEEEKTAGGVIKVRVLLTAEGGGGLLGGATPRAAGSTPRAAGVGALGGVVSGGEQGFSAILADMDYKRLLWECDAADAMAARERETQQLLQRAQKRKRLLGHREMKQEGGAAAAAAAAAVASPQLLLTAGAHIPLAAASGQKESAPVPSDAAMLEAEGWVSGACVLHDGARRVIGLVSTAGTYRTPLLSHPLPQLSSPPHSPLLPSSPFA